MEPFNAFPIAVEIHSGLLLPFEYGCFEVAVEKWPISVYFQQSAEAEIIILAFSGVTMRSHGDFEINDLNLVEDFYKQMIATRSPLKTTLDLKGGTPFDVTVDGEDQRTRRIDLTEIATVYETGIEAVNRFFTASKIAFDYLTYLPLYDEDYIAAMNFKHVEFYYYVPEANQVVSKPTGFCFGGKRLLYLSTKEFDEVVRDIDRKRDEGSKAYVIKEMLISANKAYFDGEYEVMLILFESVFEALLKDKIRSYYEGLPESEFLNSKEDEIDKIVRRPVRRLVAEEYPKCPGSLPFIDEVPEYEKWSKHYDTRNDIIHYIHNRGRLKKEEAVEIRNDFEEIFRLLFNFISPGLDADTFIEPNQHNQQKIMAHSFEPAIKRQTGTTNNTVQVTAYFVDGEGKHWLADSSVPFDLNKDYVGGPRIDFL